MRQVEVRRAEPEDYRAVHLVYSSPNAMAETLGVPFFSEREWREKISQSRDDWQGKGVGIALIRDLLAVRLSRRRVRGRPRHGPSKVTL